MLLHIYFVVCIGMSGQYMSGIIFTLQPINALANIEDVYCVASEVSAGGEAACACGEKFIQI